MDNGSRAAITYWLRRLVHRQPPQELTRERSSASIWQAVVGIGLGAVTVVKLILPASREVISIAWTHMGNGPIDPQFWAGLFVVAFFAFVYSVLTWTFIRNRRDALRTKSAARVVTSS